MLLEQGRQLLVTDAAAADALQEVEALGHRHGSVRSRAARPRRAARDEQCFCSQIVQRRDEVAGVITVSTKVAGTKVIR